MLKNAIIKGIQDMKGKDIVCLDLRKVAGAVSDFFIVSGFVLIDSIWSVFWSLM